MKQLRQVKQLIFLSICFLSSISILSQNLNRNSSKEQLINYSESIKVKIKNIPTNEFQIYDELKWVTNEISILSDLKRSEDKNDDNNTKITGIKKQFDNYFENLEKYSCQTKDYSKVYTQFLTLITQIDNVLFSVDLDESNEWTNIQVALSPISQYRQGGFKQSDCEVFKKEMLGNNLPQLFDSLFLKINTETTKKIAEKKDKLGMVSIVETDLNNYKQTLLDAQSTVKTKEKLGNNLPIMILIIGGLSIVAFGMVRLFPESVMLEWVVSGQVIQFVTVMILLSCIMALGLSGLIGENTLGTLLGGVAGYVLSQGIGKSKSESK